MSTTNTENKLQRKLKARHMNMIAIGGAIGTGLFLATGASISSAGPGGTMVAYGIIGLAVYFIMNALGEMATHSPVPGSFETYSTRYVDKSFGFMIGWNYWYCCTMTISVELVAATILMKFWFPDSPSALWSAIFMVLLLLLNLFSAGIFGESEFWFAGIKVVTIVIFLVVGVLMIFGIFGGHEVGFQNWTTEDAPFVGGWYGIFSIFMVAGFSFIGIEATCVAAGECKDPQTNVPKAIRNVFWRIMIFYIGAIFIIATLITYTDPNLLSADVDNVAMSPFTIIFNKAGFAIVASLMNAVILTSVLSCGNSTLYIASRLLYSMSMNGRAPKLFSKVSKSGVPVYAVIGTLIVGSFCFLASFAGDSVVYTWLYWATGLTGFITWFGICVSHLRFRKAFKIQNKDMGILKFKAKFYPYGTWFALIVCVFVILGQGYYAISGSGIDWYGIALAYIGLPIALVLYFAFKFGKKTKIVKYEEMDLDPNDSVED